MVSVDNSNLSRILIALPVYNEEAALPSLLERLDQVAHSAPLTLRLLFVDDGSLDRSSELLARYVLTHEGADLVTYEANRGLGVALDTILTYAAATMSDDDVLVTLDGDDTHDPALILDMVTKLLAEQLDIVVASRFTPGGAEMGLGWHRRLLSRGASLFFRLFFPIPGVRDYSSGFRAYRVEFLRRALGRWGRLVTTDGFDCMAEVIAKLSRLGPKAAEIPLVLRYDQKRGPSKMRILRTIGGYLRLLREAA